LDEMRMSTACFARAPQRHPSRLSKHLLLTFQGVTPLSKTRNQLMSTILRDSGTHIFARAHDNVRHVDKILAELTERDVLLSSTKEVLRGSRNSLVDVKYTLLPTIQ
jgi:hypothetical protein